eukprot:scaffold335711_cov22-Prasinocladus_malaysianus.AAC.1
MLWWAVFCGAITCRSRSGDSACESVTRCFIGCRCARTQLLQLKYEYDDERMTLLSGQSPNQGGKRNVGFETLHAMSVVIPLLNTAEMPRLATRYRCLTGLKDTAGS